MARTEGYQLKLLYLMKIFLEETDEEHWLMREQLVDRLERYGVSAGVKSIGADIDRLRAFGMDIIHVRSHKGGYYLAHRQFELPELKLLVDVVQASKFITAKKSNELIKKLESLTSRYEANQLQRQVFVTNRVKTGNESIYYNVDQIHTAMFNNVKIRFKYYEWNVKKETVLKKNGDDYIISPWMLVWDDENYYLRGYDTQSGIIKHYRVDKMLDIRLTDIKREGRSYFENLDTAEFAKMTFGMFSGQRWFILLLTGIIAVGLIWFYVTMPKKKEYFPLRVSLVLVLSGAIGNIIDRLFRGYVVDFFEFTFFEWPVFNVADIYVVVGVILLALMILFVVKDEDLDFKKKKDE